MNVELINTGSELLLGRTLNTHQQWICRQLADHGYVVRRQVAVPDTGEAICDAVRDALCRADWVITTGGLGPTADDLTREHLAALLGRPLHPDATVLRRVREFYAARKRPLPAGVEIQAQVPEGAQVLLNEHGTAPGLLLEVCPNPFRPSGATTWLALLPGPPRELRPMLTGQLLPLLLQKSPLDRPFVCRTLRSTGLGESQLEAMVAGPLRPLLDQGLEIGYCARPGEVDVRLVAQGPRAAPLVAQGADQVRACLGRHLYGEADEELESVVVHRLIQRRQTLAVAESCTGGLLGHRLTNVPGASAVFLGGWIPYANEAKQAWLGVPAPLLAAHGAVSEPVARALAEGARRAAGADFALAITGIAGPAGGTPEKPVGTVFIALATGEQTLVLNARNVWDRATFKQVTTQQALELLRRTLGTDAPEAGSGAAG